MRRSRLCRDAGSPSAALGGLDVPGLDAFTEIVGIDEVRALERRYRATEQPPS